MAELRHEYTNPEVMFAGIGGRPDKNDFAAMTADHIGVEMAAHGISVVEIAWDESRCAALSRFREGEQLLERHTARGIVGYRGWAYHALGRACLLLGRLDDARRLGDCALESSLSHPGFAAHVLHLRGDIAIHPDRFDAESGEAHYRKALALAEPRGMRPLVAHCHLGLGKLYGRTRKRQQSHQHLTTAATMYREMAMGFWLEQAETEINQLA